MAPPSLPADRYAVIAHIISTQMITMTVNGSVVEVDHFTKHGKEFGAATREEYEAKIIEALKSERATGIYGNGQWIFKANVKGPDGKYMPIFVTVSQRTDGSLHGTAFSPVDNAQLNDVFKKKRALLGDKVTQPVQGGLEKLEAEGKGVGIKQKEIRALQNEALLRIGALKLASGFGHVVKVVGPILAAMAIAEQAQAANLAVQEGRLPAEALPQYMALMSGAYASGVVDPTIMGADVAANEAFKKFADHYKLDEPTREALNPTLSGFLNQKVLTPEQQKFADMYKALPSVADASYAPEINRMIELKNAIENLAAENGKPTGHFGTPEEAATAKQGAELVAGMQSLFADTYLAGRDNPQTAAQMDRLAGASQKIHDLAATGALRDEAAKLFDSLPNEAPASADPATKRLISSRNALRDRLSQLEGAEKADNAAGHPVAGYYGNLNDQAYQQFYEAVAREKVLGAPQAPTASLDGLTPHKSNVASLSTASAAHVANAGPDHPNPARISPKVAQNPTGHAAPMV